MPRSDRSTADELLEHAGWVRSLARRLARDQAEAEDLSQDTWVSALSHPPVSGGPLRPWLGRVLGNLARDARRRDRRASDREALAAERRETVTNDDLLLQLERQQELARLVAELAEPYRAVVIARYYRGESAARIARRTGVPAGTVRSQLARGLELLRRRLQAEHGDDPRAALGALATAAGPHGAWAALLPWTGVTTLNTSAKLIGAGAASLAVVGVLAGLSFFSNDNVEPRGAAVAAQADLADPGEIEETVRTVDGEPESERVGVELAAPPEAAAPEPAPPGALIRLRAVDEAHAPLDGAVLRYVDERRSVRPFSEPSGADGRVELELPKGALLYYSGIDAPAELVFSLERADRALHFLRATPTPEGEVDLGDVVLEPGGTVAGLVVDAGGLPVAGATVLVSDAGLPGTPEASRFQGPERGMGLPSAETDADGRFRVSFVPTGTARVWARGADTAWSFSEPVEVLAFRETWGIQVELDEREATIAGRVVDPNGDGVGGIRVNYTGGRSWIGNNEVETDASGAFRFLPESPEPHTVQATDPEGRWRATHAVRVAPGTTDLELPLAELRWIDVEVVDDAGDSVLGAHLSTESALYSNLRGARGEELGEGAYRVAVPQGRFRLNVYADGLEAAREGPFEEETAPASLLVEMERQPRISGRVLLGGKPVAGAKVQLAGIFRETVQQEYMGFVLTYEGIGRDPVTTDDSGTFALPARRGLFGSVVVVATMDGYARSESERLAIPTGEGIDGVEIELLRGGAIEGEVRVAEGVDRRGHLVAISRGDGDVRTARTDERGFYRFERLTPGPWRVEYRKEELAAVWTILQPDEVRDPDWNCQVADGETTRFDLDTRFEEPAVLAGRLLLDGVAAEGWVATLEYVRRYDDDRPARAVVLDANGAFELTVEPDRYELTLRSPPEHEISYSLASSVDLPAGPTEWSRDLGTGALAGTSATADRLRFVWSADGMDCTAIFDVPEGPFRVEGLAAGRGHLARRSDGAGRHWRWGRGEELTIAVGETATIELD